MRPPVRGVGKAVGCGLWPWAVGCGRGLRPWAMAVGYGCGRGLWAGRGLWLWAVAVGCGQAVCWLAGCVLAVCCVLAWHPGRRPGGGRPKAACWHACLRPCLLYPYP